MNHEEIIQQAMLGKTDKTDAMRLLQFKLDNYDINNSELFKPKKIYDLLAWETDEAKYEYNSTRNEHANREKNLLKKGIETIKNILYTNNNEIDKREEKYNDYIQTL
ncbi:MAG: hypothetical protein LBL13_09695 [Bacteroidales bacterium]|jgi:hypothetical protein|nr:hypothetical protein [Bacteroidales bacterium]